MSQPMLIVTVEGTYIYSLGSTKQTKFFRKTLNWPHIGQAKVRMHSLVKKILPSMLLKEYGDFRHLRETRIVDVQDSQVPKPDITKGDPIKIIDFMNRDELMQFAIKHQLPIDPLQMGNVLTIRSETKQLYLQMMSAEPGLEISKNADNIKRRHEERQLLAEIERFNMNAEQKAEPILPRSDQDVSDYGGDPDPVEVPIEDVEVAQTKVASKQSNRPKQKPRPQPKAKNKEFSSKI